MTANKNEEIRQQDTEDVKEFGELLQKMTPEEKREVKGIMIGMQIMREQLDAQTA